MSNSSEDKRATKTQTMRAITHRQYGEPSVLGSEEIARPTPGDEEVLIQVHAAGVSIGDHHIITGKPYLVRLSPFGGVPKPKHLTPGAAMSGRVVAVGAKVTTLHIGDEVFGQAANSAFAEYLVMPANMLAPKPSNVSFEEAAAIPWGATALQGLRDAGGLKAGQRVLLIGAAGGVGTWAIQIAKALGAHVTAVCSTRSIDLVRRLGADEVIDYTKEDFTAGGARFDVVMDMVGTRSLSDCNRVLVPGGSYVACAGGGGDWVGPMFRIIGGLISSMFSGRKFKALMMTPNQTDLVTLKDFAEADKAKPIIARSYPFEKIAEALQHVGEGHTQGQVVLKIA